jgi:hypothetical protein
MTALQSFLAGVAAGVAVLALCALCELRTRELRRRDLTGKGGRR